MGLKPASAGGELDLIARITERAKSLHGKHLRLGIGDDCAILAPPKGSEIVVTTDFSLEGRHFRRDWHRPESVGHRALARGLSDLAAMGARPLGAFLSLALPRTLPRRWVERFLDGLLALAAEHRVPLAGGDTSEAPDNAVLVDMVCVGAVARRKALRRDGARVGDAVYVTGALGGAAAELAMLSATSEKFRRAKADGMHPHLFPEPRLVVGEALVKRRLATAALDVSDGLSTDLQHLCDASGVSVELELAALPAHVLTETLGEAGQINAVLHGGEEYELLFTARPEVKMPRVIAGVPVTRIGKIVASPLTPQSALYKRGTRNAMFLVDGAERYRLEPRGWEHLK